jgi:hypothetical protein
MGLIGVSASFTLSIFEVLTDFFQFSLNVVLEILVIKWLTLSNSDFFERIEDGLSVTSFNDFLDSLSSNCAFN